jgi:hemolysin activation/secretion protein
MKSWKMSPSLCLRLVFLIVLPAWMQAQAVVPPIPVEPQPENSQAPAAVAAPRLLRQLLVADTIDELKTMTPRPDAGFVVLSPSLSALDISELNKRLTGGENHPIEERILAAAAHVIESYVRQIGYQTATAIIPTQNIAEGVVRILVQLGPKSEAVTVTPATEWKIRNIKMQDTRWFSESLLKEKLRIEQGGTVRFAELDRAINWTNNNPFRQVRVHLQPVPNTSEADLTIAVQEALPLRLVASVDNSGNELIGKQRYVASVSYANLWGLDHQVSYQYITSSKPEVFQAHGFDYRVPLPWRHYVQLSSSYLRASPSIYDGLLVQEGETFTTDLRYTVPLRAGDNLVEVFGALSFKQSNNNLTWDPLFENVQVFSTKPNVFQFTLGGSTVVRDKKGAWAFGVNITASPGGINSRNTDRAFDGARFGVSDSVRFGAKARYLYGSVTVQRHQKIAPGWDLMSRGIGQVAQANLLPSEQLSIGGNSTVRGYNESIFAGDHGYVFSNDLMLPAIKLNIPSLSKKRGPLETRFLLFFDAAHTGVRHRFASDPKRAALASQGIGLRMNLANNFSLMADYGWQLSELPYPVEDRSRAHIKATLAF